MKTMNFAFVTALLVGTTAFSQNCNMVLKDGSKSTLTITTFTNPHLANTDFPDESDDKKTELISTYNADVMSGKIAPATNYQMVFNIGPPFASGRGAGCMPTRRVLAGALSGYEA